MKYAYFTIFVIVLLISCKTDDDSGQRPDFYTIVVEEICNDWGSSDSYCVTRSMYDQVKENISTGPCIAVSFTDINGNDISGYWAGDEEGCD